MIFSVTTAAIFVAGGVIAIQSAPKNGRGKRPDFIKPYWRSWGSKFHSSCQEVPACLAKSR